jgi:hypothetical protein
MAHDETISKGRSHCPACGHQIRAVDNVPVLSWLLLRGRCRDCGALISWRYPLGEALTAALYVGIVLLLRSSAREIAGTLWLDGLTAALATAALSAAVFVELVLETTEGSTAVVATNLAYPLGDVLLLSDYDDMLRFHRKNGNAITMVCAYKNLTIPYGVIEMGKNGSIEAMKEKPEMSFLTNTGMYIVEPEVLEDIEDNVATGFPDIIEKQRQRGRCVAVYPVSENDWLDMGQMTELESMRKRLYGD